MSRLLILLLLAAWARAEISVGNSVEWSVWDSALVVRGRIVELRAAALEKDAVWQRVTLKVEETLKGPAQKLVDFIVFTGAEDTHLMAWRDKKTEMVCFLVKSARYAKDDEHLAKADWALLDQDESDGIVLLAGEKMWGLTDRLGNDYDKRETMLAAIRRAIRAIPRGQKPKCLAVEHPVLPNKNAIFGTDYFYVPLDATLEAQAKVLLGHKQAKWRVKGARILRYYKSQKNAALLRKLLADEQHVKVRAPGDLSVLDHQKGENRIYPVRLAAWRVLKAWGEQVEKPVVFETE